MRWKATLRWVGSRAKVTGRLAAHRGGGPCGVAVLERGQTGVARRTSDLRPHVESDRAADGGIGHPGNVAVGAAQSGDADPETEQRLARQRGEQAQLFLRWRVRVGVIRDEDLALIR
jgi:hypothetical protein